LRSKIKTGVKWFYSMEALSSGIFRIYDEAKNKILLYIQASVTEEQFVALRKLILDELGRSGAEGKVHKLLERAGQDCRKGG